MASIRKRVGKRSTSYEFTVSNMVNGESNPIKKGGFRTKKKHRLQQLKLKHN